MNIISCCTIFIGLFFFASCQPDNKSDHYDRDQNNEEDTLVIVDPAVPEVREKYLIKDHQAGAFKIGDELPGPATMMSYQMRIEQHTRNAEDGPVNEKITIISEDGEDLVWLKPSAPNDPSNTPEKIGEILVISPKYQTKEKIGIGTLLSQFNSVYPDNELWYTYVSNMYVIETPQVKAQFLLNEHDNQASRPEIKSEKTPLKMEEFKNTATIKSIRIL